MSTITRRSDYNVVVHFMHDNHTFTALHGMSIDEAMALVGRFQAAEGGYGFVGAKGGSMNNEIVQWSLGSSTDWRDKVTDLLLRAARKNEVSALEKAMNEWTSVEDELPPSGVSVLIRYHDYYGRRRTVVGAHVRARTEEAGPYDDNGIYDEDLDCFWTKEGWYENQDNWGDYAMILFDPANKPQKWMRIPE